MSIVLIIILWSWGLTPVWVNIIGTIILSIKLLLKTTSLIGYVNEEDKII